MTTTSKLNPLILFAFTCLLLSTSVRAVDITQSPNDKRQYKSVTLANQLEVLLISDPSTDKAAAALDVKVGSGSDPKEYLGLSHYLEHMLFLGTEKYPVAGSYQAYINRHGGSHNAYTAFDNTNYFFDINADALEPALDRFSQQFIAPTFTEKYVKREKNAVHSEYSSKLKEDSRRYFSAFKATINPSHSYHNFSVGNLTTLAEKEGKSTRDVLIDFYKKHYSANLMKLVILGKEPLSQLEAWANEKFTDVPNNGASAPEFKQPLFLDDSLPALLAVEPIMDKRTLSLVFPIPSTQKLYKTKPTHFLANLIGHEGPGSLFSELKKQGLVESLSAGVGLDTGTEATFNLSYSLTQEGLKKWETIVEQTFAYIKLVKKDGINRLYFDEQKKMMELAFVFQEHSEPIHYVSSLASRLQEVETKDILVASYLMNTFDADGYLNTLGYLNTNNVQITLMAKGVKTDRHTDWYEAPYSYKKLSTDQLTKFSTLSTPVTFSLPKKNDFIPSEIALLSATPLSSPQILDKGDGYSLWYYYDTSFGTPKSNLFVNLRSPIANDTPKHSILTSLLVSMIQDELSEYTYSAYLAGLNYELYGHIRGITIKVGGYSEKQSLLLAKILGTIKTIDLKQDRFKIYKEEITRSLVNAAKKKPYQQTTSEIRKLILRPQWTEQERLAVISTITLEDLQRFKINLFEQLEVVALSSGNISRGGSLNIGNAIKTWLLDDKTEKTTVKRAEVAYLDTDDSFVHSLTVEHPDTGYTLYLQGANRSYSEQANFQLLTQLLSSPYYEKLRTEDQLGYIVFATNMSYFEVPALGFIVQSPVANARQLESVTQHFLNTYAATLSEMPPKEFKQHKAALLSRLFEKDNTLSARSNRFWREIDRENYSFDSREKLAAEINSINHKDFVAFYQAVTRNKGRRLLVYSNGSKSSENTLTELESNSFSTYKELTSSNQLWSDNKPYSGSEIRNN